MAAAAAPGSWPAAPAVTWGWGENGVRGPSFAGGGGGGGFGGILGGMEMVNTAVIRVLRLLEHI